MTALRRAPAAALAAALALAAVPASAEPDRAALDAATTAIARRAGSPGAAFAVSYRGRVAYARGIGLADVATRSPMDAGTMFALASCSKPITAMAVMKLVDERRLTLETPAFAFLGFAVADPRARQITIKELLNHSSGLPHDAAAATGDPMDTARAASHLTLLFDPGTQQAYSNAGFNVLGAVVEKASGQSYADFVTANVFAPAGVVHAAALDGATAIPGQAVRYDKRGRPVENLNMKGGTPAGGWVLSASDMVRVLIAYDAGKIVSPAARAAMLAPPEPPLRPRPNGSAFGLGWDVVDRSGGGVYFGKNGGIDGSHAWVEHRPDGTDVAAFYNGGNGSGAHRAGLAALERALDGP